MLTKELRQEYIDVLQKCLDTKWKDPVYPEFMYAPEDCPACNKYLYSESETRCDACPICKAGFRFCLGTPCSEDEDAGDDGESGLCRSHWDDMINNERLFLQALIDHLKTGHEPDTFKNSEDKRVEVDNGKSS